MTPNNFRVKSGLTVGTTISGGNTSITGFVNATSTVNASGLAVGTAFVANSTGAFHTGTINAASLTVSTNVIANTTQVTSNVNMLINNNKHLRFQTVNSSAYAYFIQQNDDNFVFYTSNTTYGQRAVWSVFANSVTSALRMDVPIYPIAGISANGAIGTAGQVLKSNGAGIFWDTSGGTGTVTSVATGNGLTGGTITTTGTLSVTGGSTLTVNTTGVHVNSVLSLDRILTSNNGAGTNMAVGDDAWFGDVNTADTVSIRGQQSANNGYIVFGNADTTTKLGRTGAGPLTYNGDFAATGSVNAASHTVGTVFVANTTRVAIGTTVGLQANGGIGTAGQVLTSNATTVYWSTPTTGTVTQVSSGNGLTGGPITSTGTLAVTAGSGIASNATGVHVVAGNGTIVSNATGVYVNASALSIATSQLTGDVALGANTSGNYVATITAGNGISGSSSAEGGTPTIAVVAGIGIASNSTGVHVVAGNGTIVSNATGVYVNASALSIATSQLTGDVALGTSTSGNYVATISNANGISGSSSAEGGTPTIGVVTGSTLTVNTTGIHVNSALSIASLGLTGDLTVSGNLTVSGTRTYVNTTTLDIGDNIFTLNADLGAVAPSQDAGIEIMRGTSANVQFLWDETNDRWSTNGQPLAVSSLVATGAASGITTLAAGNTTITGFANVTSTLQVGGGSTFGGTVTLGSVGLSSNGSLGTAGQVLHSNGTATYWAADDNSGGTVTSVATGSGLTGGTITTTGTLSVLANTGIIANATGLYVNSAYIATLTANAATFSNTILVPDTRNANTTPETVTGPQVRFDFKANATDNLADGGTFFGEMTFRPYGSGTDWTGGPSHQLGFTANNNVYHRSGTSTTWGSWGRLYKEGAVLAAANTTITGFASVASARGAVAVPTAGQNNSALYVTGSDTAYGLLFGTDPATGRGWIQAQRTDGTATTYNLRLNPAGGITEFGAGYTETEVANTAVTGSYTMNCAAANFFELTLTGNTTIAPSNVPANGRVWSGSIAAKQDATGGRTITWPTGTKYAGGVAPPATTTANALDIWSLMTYDGGSTWIVSLSVKGVA